jgi:F-type H+-transporting ATPase subunit a
VLVANWMELLPGVDSIGLLEPAHAGVTGAPAVQVLPGVCGVAKPGSPFANGAPCAAEAAEPGEGGLQAPARQEHQGSTGFIVTPFVRAAATDLNFTLALALIAMFMTEYYGFRALGLGYLGKFFQFNIDKIGSSPISAIDPVVGLLELVSELSRVISFTFRLFGNIFAGQVLLFVLTSLVPFLVPVGLGLLELFVGAIQAVVFGLLTLAFMSGAVTSHHGDEHEEHGAEAPAAAAAH